MNKLNIEIKFGPVFTKDHVHYFHVLDIENSNRLKTNQLVIDFLNSIPLRDYPDFLKYLLIKAPGHEWLTMEKRGFVRGGGQNAKGIEVSNKENMILFDGFYCKILISDLLTISLKIAEFILDQSRKFELKKQNAIPLLWEEWIQALIPVLEYEIIMEEKK